MRPPGALLVLLLAPLPCLRVPQRAVVGGAPVSSLALAPDPHTVIGPRHLGTGYPAIRPDGAVNVVVEIPSGTTAKFEVDDGGALRWALDRDDGSPRAVDYLAYPANYGMVPRTLAGDGDALDAVVLGRAAERGHVARTRVIGVLKVAQGATRDDKLIAVPVEPALESGFSRLWDLAELDRGYPASREILALWFAHSWGRGVTEVIGWGDAAEAAAILEDAMTAFSERRTGPPAGAAPRPRAGGPSAAPARAPPAPAHRAAPG